MMRLATHLRKRLAGERRRGFALPLVLMVMLMASLFLGAAFERQTSQARIVERQLAEYRRHHEMFGIRALLTKWLTTQDSNSLAELARDEDKDFSYGFVLPSGAQVRIQVSDGQGLPGVPGDDAPETQRVAFNDFLDRYQEIHEDIIPPRRLVGPPEVSLNTAPTSVLEALVPENGEKFAKRLERERERDPVDIDALENALRGVGLDPQESIRLRQIITFSPVLWQLDISVRDDQGERYFQMLFEFDSIGAIELKWKEVTPLSDDEEDEKPNPRRY